MKKTLTYEQARAMADKAKERASGDLRLFYRLEARANRAGRRADASRAKCLAAEDLARSLAAPAPEPVGEDLEFAPRAARELHRIADRAADRILEIRARAKAQTAGL